MTACGQGVGARSTSGERGKTMKFEIRGADKETGEDIVTTIEAIDKFNAQRIAREGGLLISSCVPIAEVPAVRPTPAVHIPHREPNGQAVIVPVTRAAATVAAPQPQIIVMQAPPVPSAPPSAPVVHTYVN